MSVLEVFLVTGAGVALGQLAPGPNFLAVASASLSSGRRAGLWLALGVASAAGVWVAFCALGLATLLALAPGLLVVMKLLGGGYLLFLAVRALVAAIRHRPETVHAALVPMAAGRAFWRGVGINLTNPKSALMWAAVATFMFGAGLSTGSVLAFIPVACFSALLIYSGYALLFSTGPARAIYTRIGRIAQGLFAAAFGALGGELVVSGVREAMAR